MKTRKAKGGIFAKHPKGINQVTSSQVWDPRTEDPVLSLEPVEGETPADCWTVAFGNSYNDAERCIAAGQVAERSTDWFICGHLKCSERSLDSDAEKLMEVTHWGGLYSAVFDRIWQWGCEDFWFVGASGEWRLLFWEARTCWKKHLGGQTPWDGIPMFAMAFATCNSRLGVQKMMTRLISFFVDEFDPKLSGSKGHPDEQAGSFLDLADGRMFQNFFGVFHEFWMIWFHVISISWCCLDFDGNTLQFDEFGGLRCPHWSRLWWSTICARVEPNRSWWNPTSTPLSLWGITPQRALQVGRRRREWTSLNWNNWKF